MNFFPKPTNDMDQSEWIDRGWWLSVEICKKPPGRKNRDHALELLKMAHERYDLLLESGKTIARGIFTVGSDLENLSKLLETVNRWTDRTVFIRGRKLSGREVTLVTNFLICAASSPPCQGESADLQMNYLGCHLMKIGFMNYSLAALKNGARYWFSFFKPDTGSARRFNLDKGKLKQSMKISELCPKYPANTHDLLDRLPAAISLNDKFQRQRWVLLKYRFRTSWPGRYPPIVPYSESIYRSSMKISVLSIGCENE
jgi:hypothetical protein